MHRPRNDVGQRRTGGAQHSLDIIDGPHRLGRSVLAGDDAAANPVWLLRNAPPGGIPAPRQALC